MIEPRLVEPWVQAALAANAAPLRLIETQAIAHLGRRLLTGSQRRARRGSAMAMVVLARSIPGLGASNPDLRLVDSRNSPALAVTLLAFQLESGGSYQLVGTVEVQVIGADHVIDTDVIRATESLSAELPGNLADAAGRLLQRLASDRLARGDSPLRRI
jgi:hypothetical protein